MQTKAFLVLALASLGSCYAVPSEPANAPRWGNGSHHHHHPPPPGGPDHPIVRSIGGDELHARALASHPADQVISARELRDFMARHAGSDKTAYLRDERAFVPMASVVTREPGAEEGKAAAAAVDKRQAMPCYAYDQYQMNNGQAYWGDWAPASTCVYTGLNDKGATQDLSWSKTVSITNDNKIEWTAIKDVIKATIGFSVTNSWTHGGSSRCYISGHSVGQIWIRNYLGKGDISKRLCQDCGVSGDKCISDWEYQGGVVVPEDNTDEGKGYSLGCSEGNNNVKCEG